MIEEYARHNGHADLIRELVDGQWAAEGDALGTVESGSLTSRVAETVSAVPHPT
jgi:hypothetical protein